MKKILLLGFGPPQQRMITDIKKNGYYVIVCHNLLNKVVLDADIVYHVDPTNDIEVLKIAQKEQIDGIASSKDNCMHTVAYIASKLGLVGNSVEAINNLQNKFLFRQLQKKVGAYSPECYLATNIDEMLKYAKNIKFPVIIKPCESSGGSSGVKLIEKYDEELIINAFNDALSYSRNNGVIIEGYVPRGLTNLECDVFVHKNSFLWVGYESNICSPEKPMQPCGGMFPANETEENKARFEKVVTNLLLGAGIKHGMYNVEAIMLDNGEPFIIEINARMAGATVPEVIKRHCDVDVYKLLVSTSVGDDSYFLQLKNSQLPLRYITSFELFPRKEGIFTKIYIDEKIKKYVYDTIIWGNIGDKVYKTKNSLDSLGKVYLEYPDRQTQIDTLMDLYKYIKPIVE